MTSLATLLGMIPMAIGAEAGSEQYAPLARAIIGGLAVSVVATVYLVPAVYLLIHGRRKDNVPPADDHGDCQLLTAHGTGMQREYRYSGW
jgi:hypothetical protein